MSQRTADLYLIDLIDAADAIDRSLRGITFDQFVGHHEKRDGILWNLTIIGEAASRLSEELRQKAPQRPGATSSGCATPSSTAISTWTGTRSGRWSSVTSRRYERRLRLPYAAKSASHEALVP